MNYKYRAITSDDETVEGYIEASDQKHALSQLRERYKIVINLNSQNNSSQKFSFKTLMNMDIGTLLSGGKVPLRNLAVFFRQLSTMINSGMDLPVSLEVISKGEKNIILNSAIVDIQEKIDRGTPLSEAMSQQKIFDALLVSIVKAGEEAQLSDALEQAAVLLEKQDDLRKKIRGAMFYPTFIMIFAIAVLAFFFMFLVPRFQETFSALNIELPAVTEKIFELGNWFSDNWKKILLIVLGIYIVLKIFASNSRTKNIFDRFKLKLPLVKNLTLKSSMARSSRILSALLSSGVSLVRALEMTEGTAGNIAVKEGYSELRANVLRGVSLGDAAKQTDIFPILVSQMMRIGEQTSRVDKMLERVANWYDKELDEQIKSSVAVLEPFMIIFVGIIIALIAVSVFTPITSAIVQLS